MNYLVTGAAGFIGAALAEYLVNKGHNVTTIDNLSTGSREHVPHDVTFIEGNTYEIPKLLTPPNLCGHQEFDAIFHIAGQSSGEVSFDNPVYDLQTNTQSTLILLNLAKEIGCKKFIYASSMSTYGDHQPPVCTEQTTTVPRSFYAVGKLASENYMRIYSENFGIACTALRLFNVYGVGQNMANLRQGMASIYLAMAIKDHLINVRGSKDRFRDFVYIDDVVDAFVKCLDRQNGYDYFNVCTGVPTTVESVISTILEKLPYDVEVRYTEGTPGDQFGIYGDYAKIKASLGWKPTVDFRTGMTKMIDWAVSL